MASGAESIAPNITQSHRHVEAGGLVTELVTELETEVETELVVELATELATELADEATGGKSSANVRPIAVAMSAKSASGTRNTPKRNAAPQCFLLRMNERSSISGRTGAFCAGRKSTSSRNG